MMIGLIIFVSCTDAKRSRVLGRVNEWQGKEIHYLEGAKFVLNGDSVLGDSLNQNYRVFSYVDSIGCVSCKLKLSEWGNFISMVDSIYPNIVSFQFVFQPYRTRELQLMLKREKLSALIYVDKNGRFGELNKFPENMDFQTFLLDKDNRVLAIGNPIHNPKVKELYLKIIRGENIERGDESKETRTKVEIDKTVVSLGSFDWQEEQKAAFVLKNTGDRLLVIQDVTTSCGCTTVAYAKEPVQPGGEVALEVAYKADHPEHFDKTVTVHCNAEASPLVLRINGNAG